MTTETLRIYEELLARAAARYGSHECSHLSQTTALHLSGETNGLRESRQDWTEGFAHLPRLHDVWRARRAGETKGGRHCWALNEEESQPFFRQALDLGINFFDTANVYSSGDSEQVLGNFLKANTRREAVVIATKVHGVMRDEPNGRGLSRKAILFELDESLRRLQPTTWTSTRFIAGITRRRSRRRSRRCTTW